MGEMPIAQNLASTNTWIKKLSTKERIFAAAEILFAEKGFERVSLREITSLAKVNVSAVSYHFGSMQGLAEEVMVRYIEPINTRRLELLEKEVERRQSEDIQVECIMEAFMRPLLEVVSANQIQERLFAKMIGHSMRVDDQSTGGKGLPEVLIPQFRMVIERFTQVLSIVLPEVKFETLAWRMHMSFGAFAHALTHGDHLEEWTGGRSKRMDLEQLLSELIVYCSAGLKAPAMSHPLEGIVGNGVHPVCVGSREPEDAS